MSRLRIVKACVGEIARWRRSRRDSESSTGNAIYVIHHDWEHWSKMSKQELMNDQSGAVVRIPHQGDWYARVKRELGLDRADLEASEVPWTCTRNSKIGTEGPRLLRRGDAEGDDGRLGRSGLCSIPNLYAAAQDVVPPAVYQIGRWAANPVWRSELCGMLDMDFGEYPFHALP